MTKIAFIGAGSAVFSRNIVADILSFPALEDVEIVLMDIDERRLNIALKMSQDINTLFGTKAKISATLDRRQAIDGSDFVMSCIGVGGKEAVHDDLKIPFKHGLRQTIGDTLGVGGIFRSARGIPVLLDICREMEELCPKALLMNYSNPMATHMLAVARATSIQSVGLCHGVVHTAQLIRALVEMRKIPAEEIEAHFTKEWGSAERTEEWLRWMSLGDDPDLSYTCAGINHMACFLTFTSKGRDLYPEIREAVGMSKLRRLDPVRMEMVRWLGMYLTETSTHMAEYLPYFMRHDSEVERHDLRVLGYIDTVEDLDRATAQLEKELAAGQPPVAVPYKRSVEYASRIINAVATNEPYVFNGNVHNGGGRLISNLPGDSCVEVPCVADARGISPTSVGNLPPQFAALITTNVIVQDLIVRGILEKSKDFLYQAAILDPNTSASLTLPQIADLMKEMFEAHRERIDPELARAELTLDL